MAFGAAALVVLGLLALTWVLAGDAARATQMVARTHEVITHLARVRTDTVQIELSTQSFRVTGEAAHLAERNAAIAEREGLLEELRAQTLDNPRQQANWARLRQVVDERLEISRRVEALRQTQGPQAASAYVATAPLQQTRQRTRDILESMDREERQMLQARSQQQATARQQAVAAGVVACALLLVLLGATFVAIRRQLADRQAQQRTLAESEEDLATTLQSIGDAVIATDVDGRITRMNPVAERLTGWASGEARGTPIDQVFAIVNEQTGQPAEIPVARVIARGAMVELANHTVLIARDGSRCPIADSAAPIRDTGGRIRGVVIVFRDESAARAVQHQARQQNVLLEQRVRERTTQLRMSEDHLHSVINNVPALIAYVDAEQRYVYVNDQYRQRFAPDRTDVTGCTVRDVLGDERYRVAAPLIAQVLAGQATNYDWQPFPDVWQAISYLPSCDDAGRVAGYYVLGTDITERRRVELQLRRSEQQLQRVLEGSDQGYWDWDMQSNKLQVSTRWETMLGYEPGEIRTDPEHWPALVHPDDLPRAMEAIRQHLDGQVPRHQVEFRARTKLGGWRWILTRGSVVARAADGTPLMMSGTHTDVTERRKVQDALSEALRDKEALLKEVHHRVKNNLQVITSLLRLEGARSALPHTRSVLADMQGRIHTMALLHQSLYRAGTFASIALGDYLGQLATQAFQTQAPQGGQIGIDLRLSPLRVAMDAALPCGLLVNELISNAFKHAFTPGTPGQVGVELLPVAGSTQWILRVGDNGRGLPEGLQRDEATTLGLQLVGDLCRQIDGAIEITSAPGTGTVFTVRFSPVRLVDPVVAA